MMYSFKVFTILTLLAASSYGTVVNVKNSHSTAIIVSAGDAEYTVVSNGFVTLNNVDNWEGTISAVPLGAEITEGPKTKVDITLSDAGDSYSINLVDGYNLGVKVIPQGSTNCSATVCSANLLKLCPTANQVLNSLLEVVACKNSPIIMSKVCPGAVVDDTTAANVQSCSDATSLLVIFI